MRRGVGAVTSLAMIGAYVQRSGLVNEVSQIAMSVG